MTIWNPKKPRQLLADDTETDLPLRAAMEQVVAGVIYWCEGCQAYHVSALSHQTVNPPTSHALH